MQTETNAKDKLVYLGGWGRSGSSLIANILGSIPGAVSVGELRYIWDRGVIENRHCGCRDKFQSCLFWSQVFSRAGIPMDRELAERLTKTVGSSGIYIQLRHMLLGQFVRHNAAYEADNRLLDTLYRTILAESGCDVIVDASKTPPYATNLDGRDGFDMFFIHLVRDPRAVAFSWTRKRETGEGTEVSWFPRYSAIKSAVYWLGINLLGLLFQVRAPERYLRVRYEDFCEDPKTVIDEISAFCSLDSSQLNWQSRTSVTVQGQHSISGNPSRFRVGEIEIQADDEWREKMPRGAQLLVTALCAPLLAVFGYRLGTTEK